MCTCVSVSLAHNLRSGTAESKGSVNNLSAYSVPDTAQGVGETQGTRKPHVPALVELTFQWRIVPVFILIDAATLVQLLTSSAYFWGGNFKAGGCTLLPLLSARPSGSGPGMVHLQTWVWSGGRQGWKGPGSGRRLRKERFTGYLHRSLLDHTTRGPTGGRDKESVIEPSSQVIPLREAQMEQSVLGGTTG